MNLITTAPTVVYEGADADGDRRAGENPSKLPICPRSRRSASRSSSRPSSCPRNMSAGDHPVQPEARRPRWTCSTTAARCMLIYDMPMNEVVMDFFDKLKSVSAATPRSTTSSRNRAADLVKLDMLVNARRWMPCRSSCTAANSQYRGRELVAKMRELIPRQMFDVAIQAAIGFQHHRPRDHQGPAQERAGQVLRRRHHPQKKLLEKQKAGKKRMKQVGNVEDSAGGLPGRAAGG